MKKKQIADIKIGKTFRIDNEKTAPVWVKTGKTTKKGGLLKYYCNEYGNIKRCNALPIDKIVYIDE